MDSLDVLCSTSDGYGGGQRHDMTVAQYVDWWLRHKQGHEEQLLYLKDWHFVNEFPEYKVSSPYCP